MTEKTVATAATPGTSDAVSTKEETRTHERYATPPVDIYETPEGLVVLADIPGVGQDDLDVRVDHNLLTIRGHARHAAPHKPVYQEYALVDHFRQFELSDKVDAGKITAELKHGVLVLHLPKADAAKPRQIAVQVS